MNAQMRNKNLNHKLIVNKKLSFLLINTKN